jgi:hypothetical protein
MTTLYCVVMDPVLEDEETIDPEPMFFRADDPQLPIVLGRSGVESTPIFETAWTWEQVQENGHDPKARKTGERVFAPPGSDVAPEDDPFE